MFTIIGIFLILLGHTILNVQNTKWQQHGLSKWDYIGLTLMASGLLAVFCAICLLCYKYLP